MKFLDEVKIQVVAGKGGNGCMSFRREKFIPFGGPDGGNGGRGGHVIIQATSKRHTLVDLHYQSIIRAQSGKHGKGSMLTGGKGQDEIIEVPVGTLVFEDNTNEQVIDLSEEGQSIIIAKGGDPGFGNAHYKSSTNRAPRKTTQGFPGEAFDLRLELRLLANVGLLGMPNAGKSSLLRAVSAARPKVANYPFTTLTPQLGVIDTADKPIVMADIPGLIESASTGAGLGFQFLRHLSRCELLLHLVDVSCDDPKLVSEHIQVIENELHAYSAELENKPRWLVLNKMDTLAHYTDTELVWLDTFQASKKYQEVFKISAITNEGVDELLEQLKRWWEEKLEMDN